MRRALVALASAALGALALFADAAATAAPPTLSLDGETLDVRADRLDADLAAGTATLEGHVDLRGQTLHLTAPRLDLRLDGDSRPTWIKAHGPVVADLRGTHAEADEVEVDLERRTVELRRGVRLIKGSATIAADHASLSLVTQKVTLEGMHGVLGAPASSR